MIRSNYRDLDPRELTIEERQLRMTEIMARAQLRSSPEKEKALLPPSPNEIHELFEPRVASPQGRIPFGFQQDQYGRSMCEPDMKWIDRIRELALQKLSTEKIARFLNKEDLTSKRAGKWSRTAVWRILKRIKKKAVTESLRNGPAQTPDSVTLPTIASKRDPLQDSNLFSTENDVRQKPCLPKPLQINDFQEKLPVFDSKQIGTGQLNAFAGLGDGPMGPNSLLDDSLIGRVNGARGRTRIVFPLEAAAVMSRQRRYQPPKPPAIQNLLKQAYQLNEMMVNSRINRFTLSKNIGLDPSRISQILNLLKLDAKIQNYIRDLPPTKHRDSIGDRQWMRLARIHDPELQLSEFHDLLTQNPRRTFCNQRLQNLSPPVEHPR